MRTRNRARMRAWSRSRNGCGSPRSPRSARGASRRRWSSGRQLLVLHGLHSRHHLRVSVRIVAVVHVGRVVVVLVHLVVASLAVGARVGGVLVVIQLVGLRHMVGIVVIVGVVSVFFGSAVGVVVLRRSRVVFALFVAHGEATINGSKTRGCLRRMN